MPVLIKTERSTLVADVELKRRSLRVSGALRHGLVIVRNTFW